jgi:hypothetical protein
LAYLQIVLEPEEVVTFLPESFIVPSRIYYVATSERLAVT